MIAEYVDIKTNKALVRPLGRALAQSISYFYYLG